jgi:hypothetical protein
LSLRPGGDSFTACAVAGLKEPCRGERDDQPLRRSPQPSGRRTGDRMRRRDFIGVIYGAALAWPCAADAQQPGKVWRIGNVYPTPRERSEYLAQALEQRLADLGYVQGRNIVLLHRFAAPQPDKLQEVIISLLPQIDLLVVLEPSRCVTTPNAAAAGTSNSTNVRLTRQKP